MNHRPSFWAIFVLVVVQSDVILAACGGNPSDCGAPPTNSNLNVNPVKTCYSDTETVAYVCSGVLKGPGDNTCQNGGWKNGAPTCEVFTCSPPTDDTDVIRKPSLSTYNAYDVVNFECPSGTELEGPSSATCVKQDEWSPPSQPICRAICAFDAEAIPNGAITPTDTEFLEDDTATVVCDEGYSLEAGTSATITCGSDGTWQNVPSCLENCDVPSIPNSDFSSGDTLNHGQTVYIDCDDGYSYNQETRFEVTCFYGGLSWKTVVPTECFSDCTVWAAPTNGQVTGDYLHGTTATFSCDIGYALQDPADATTTCDDGTWNLATVPNCVALATEESFSLACDSNQFRVHIPVALLNNPSGENIHLIDQTCVGSIADGFVTLESSYNDCGTTIQVDEINEEISYINRVGAENFDGSVTTEKMLDINVQCTFDQYNLVSTTFIIANNITFPLAFHGGPYFTLKVYKEDNFVNQESPPVNLYEDQLAYLKIQLESGTNETLFGTHCHATPTSDAYDPVKHALLEDGCAKDERVTVIETDSPTIFPKPAFAFSMSKLQFAGDSEMVYVHCFAKICETFEDCSQQCPLSHRRRRSTDSHIYHLVSSGALVWKPETTADRRLDEQVIMYLLLACAVVSTFSFFLVVYLACRYFSRRSVAKKGKEEKLEYE
ncbi:CUB and sushi domain-containing protein 3 [Holothuria leucospilota]|uniref:CUB and sushi domain-containing protein 3 n=1 Tax=Holothuria leucospilota TaxID=206669 RepID=A0A9Q1BMH7_HOLLE|nr:CUB and sushi domain-containing protein 3 [Holothuria leucospilota]